MTHSVQFVNMKLSAHMECCWHVGFFKDIVDRNCPKSLIANNFPITSLSHINVLVNNGDGCTMVAVGIKDYGLTILGAHLII